MPLYRFYRIVSDAGPEEYIGSTRSPLHKRFWEHRNRYSKNILRCASRKLFDKYGVEACSIILIHEMECATKEEAFREERRIYDERKATIVNIRRPYISPDEKKMEMSERNKIYQLANMDKFREANKRHQQANKEIIKQRKKEYQEANRDKIREKAKAYREANGEKIRAYHRAWEAKQKERPSSRTTLASHLHYDPSSQQSPPVPSEQESPDTC